MRNTWLIGQWILIAKCVDVQGLVSCTDLAMTGWQQQMHSADHSDGEEHILDALLNPRFRDEWTQATREDESKVFENCDGEIGVIAPLASEYKRAFPKEGPLA